MKRYLLSIAICMVSICCVNAQKVACATNVIQIVNGKGTASQKSIKNSGLTLLNKSAGQYIYGNNVELAGGAIKPLNNHACYLKIMNTRTVSAVIYFKNKADANNFWNELMSQSYIPCKGSDNLYEKVHNNVVYHVVQKAVYKNGWYSINLNAKRPVQNDSKTSNKPANTVKKVSASPLQTNQKVDKPSQKKPITQGAKDAQNNNKPTTPSKVANTTNNTKTNVKESAKTQAPVDQKTKVQPMMRFTPETPRKN